MTDQKTPKKFVGLHSHTHGSIFDAIGTVQDHIDYAIQNGMDSLAVTNHGNMFDVPKQFKYVKSLKDKGINFKSIPGNEFYFVPSLKNWSHLYEQERERKALEKLEKKKEKELLTTEEENEEKELLEIAEASSGKNEGDEGGTSIENEEESKTNKWKDPINQRSHLVLLAKNNEGLKSLFRLTSESNINGFYRYPRIDFDLLRKYSNGNLVASTACIASYLGKIIFDNQENSDSSTWSPNNHNHDLILNKVSEEIYKFQEILGKENFFLELQFNDLLAQHLQNQYLIEASKLTGAQLVVTCDAHYSNPEHWREREIYKLIGWQQKNKGKNIDFSSLPKKIDELKCELYPKNAEQLWSTYKKYNTKYDFYNDDEVCEAIERTHEIAHQLIGNVEIDKTVKLPVNSKLISNSKLVKLESLQSSTDEDTIAFKQLKELAIQGLIKRKQNNDVYIERLKEELAVVKHLKFSKYFLTYYKIMDAVGKQMLTGTSRGSAGGSLLAYVLNITQIDPIKYNLLFARFLVKNKKGFPDIDSDCSDRDKAVNIIQELFGETNVLPVTTFAQLQLSSLCKDLAKIFGVPFEEVNQYTSKMRAEALAVAKQEAGFDAQQWELTLEVAKKDSPSFNEFMKKMEQYPEFKQALEVLFKQNRSVGRHAGGLVVTTDAINNLPLIKAKGGIQTPWTEGLNARDLEEFGFLKFDVLGLGTLRMFEECIKRILQKQGKKYVTFLDIKKWYYENLHPDNNNMDDVNVYKHVFWDKRFIGIFQFVKENVQDYVSKIKPTSIEDLAAVTALHRPGPLGIGAEKIYFENRQNPENIIYKHPLLKEVFGSTYGIMIYQEQLMLLYNKLAGVPLDDTDGVRKAFTKKDLSNKEKALAEIKKLRDDFIKKCKKTNDISEEISGEIFDDMEKFVAYSFNLSHSAGYCIISYQCAFLLTYYPNEWVCSYLDYCSDSKGKGVGDEDPKAIALSEARSLGYIVDKPDINESSTEYVVKEFGKEKYLIPAITSLKHVGKTVFYEIERFRPYNTVEDLLWNSDGSWRHSKFNKRALSTLIKLEALNSMNLVGEQKIFSNYKQMHTVLVDNHDELKKVTNRKRGPKFPEVLKKLVEDVKDEQDWTMEEKIKFSKELAGSVDISSILTDDLRLEFKSRGIDCIDKFTEEGYYWGVLGKITLAKTKTGKDYLKIKILGDTSEQLCYCWNYKPTAGFNPASLENSIVVSKFNKSNFGLSTFFSNIKKIL